MDWRTATAFHHCLVSRFFFSIARIGEKPTISDPAPVPRPLLPPSLPRGIDAAMNNGANDGGGSDDVWNEQKIPDGVGSLKLSPGSAVRVPASTQAATAATATAVDNRRRLGSGSSNGFADDDADDDSSCSAFSSFWSSDDGNGFGLRIEG